MSILKQCESCRRQFEMCGYYTNEDPCPCLHYQRPVDNSKMFGRWYKFTGRIGRLEYALTILFAVILYFVTIYSVVFISGIFGVQITPFESKTSEYLFSIGVLLPSAYISIAAGIKRCNDTRVSKWYCLTPLIPLFVIGLIPLIIFGIGCMYLFKDKGEDGVNEHGSNPVQPYEEQIYL